MSSAPYSEDSLAVLMLCARVGSARSADAAAAPLKPTEWSELARRIHASSVKRPRGMLGLSAEAIETELQLDAVFAERIVQLLSRRAEIALEIERWTSRGIWLLTRADDDYPKKLRQRLGSVSPPVFFGAGPRESLGQPGIAVIGSRSPTEAGTLFAQEAGRRSADAGLVLYSGAARGIDRSAMQASTESGGRAVGVLADSLERAIAQRETREALLEGKMTLVTAYHPSATFTVASAMGRNKYVYSFSDGAIIASIDQAKGGTWNGALEALRRRWVPVFVATHTASTPGGNGLLAKGTLSLDLSELPARDQLRSWLDAANVTMREETDSEQQQALDF